MSRRWVRAGHEVSVVCGIPNHPAGVVYQGYRKQICLREEIEGIDVRRAWVYVTPNAGTFRRMGNFLSFALSGFVTSELIRRADLVIASSPQFLTGIAGVGVSKSRRIPLILEVRDLWPDSIRAVELPMHPSFYNLLRRTEAFLYRRADHVVIVSDGFRAHLDECQVPAAKITTITNGVDMRLFHPESNGSGFQLPDSLRGRIVVSYVGTQGLAHSLETILAAAEELRCDENIRFLLVGEGARSGALRAAAEHLPNVIFLPQQTRPAVADILRKSDIGLVLLKKDPLFRTVIPSKMFEAMGCGCPLVLGVEGIARDILEAGEAGIPIEPENPAQLAQAIRALAADPERRRRLGRNGAAYAAREYNFDLLADRYLDTMRQVVDRWKGNAS